MPSMLSYFLPLKIEWQYREIYEVLYKFINKHWTVNVYDGNVGSMNWLCYLMSALQPAHVPGAKWSLTLSFKPKIFPLPLSVSKFWLVILGRRRKKKRKTMPITSLQHMCLVFWITNHCQNLVNIHFTHSLIPSWVNVLCVGWGGVGVGVMWLSFFLYLFCRFWFPISFIFSFFSQLLNVTCLCHFSSNSDNSDSALYNHK